MREPDARDAARVLFFALFPISGAFVLGMLHLPAAASILLQASFFLIPLHYGQFSGLGAFAGSGFAPLPLRRIAYVVLASLGTFWLLNGLTHLQDLAIRALGLQQQAEEQVRMIQQGIDETQKAGAAPLLVLYVIIPPLCEEAFFRGILFRGLMKRFGFGIGLAATTILFAWFHQMNVQRVLMVFLGCYFGTLVYLTGSLWAGVLAHAMNNLAVIVLTLIYKGKLPDFVAPWWMYALSAVVFALAMTMLALDRSPVRESPPVPE